jgi:hypothetical protein
MVDKSSGILGSYGEDSGSNSDVFIFDAMD